MNKLTLRRIAARICNTVFPRKCILCGELLDPDRGAEMCEKCLGAYSDALALTCPVCGKGAKSCRCRCGSSPDAAKLTVLGFYTGADSDIGRLVYRFKREYDRDIRKFFARSLAAALSSDIGKDISDFTVTFPPRSRGVYRSRIRRGIHPKRRHRSEKALRRNAARKRIGRIPAEVGSKGRRKTFHTDRRYHHHRFHRQEMRVTAPRSGCRRSASRISFPHNAEGAQRESPAGLRSVV